MLTSSLHQVGSLNATAFRVGYVDHLRHLWRQDRQAFLDLVTLATGGVTERWSTTGAAATS